MQLLLINNQKSYSGKDDCWNLLRLAQTALSKGHKVNIFLINDGVELANVNIKPPENYFNLQDILKEIIEKGATVKLCKTCIDRCGINEDEILEGVIVAGMDNLLQWIEESDKVVSF